jgi:8-oxo-dGTP pyrophosphatase MutT (NUDIX family)
MTNDLSKHTIVVFVFLERDGKYFTLRRSNTNHMSGFYCPPSGRVEQGEDCFSAAVREVKEEAGIDIKAEDLELIHVGHRMADVASKIPYFVDLFFKCSSFKQEPFNAEPDKSDQAVWMNFEDAQGDGRTQQDNYFSHIISNIQKGENLSIFGWNGEDRVTTLKEAV